MDDPKAKWYFREMSPGEMNEDPVQGEFFTQQDLADRLVRETLQNSLDEAAGEQEPVRVCFAFRSADEWLGPDAAAKYLHGLDVHLDNTEGVPDEIRELVRLGVPMPFFVIEDFGTKGLVGDPSQSDDWEGQPAAGNSFYWFFRNVGRSGKGEGEAGSWGLGKWVFPDASKIHSFLAFSVRPDRSTVLMGQSVLKKHTVGSTEGSNAKYAPYGFFCYVDEDELQMPIMTGPMLESFKSDFRLERDIEPGLSIVIPFPQEELRYEDIVRAAVHYYFYPIVTGRLIVEVEREGKCRRIDVDSIEEVADEIDWSTSGVTADDMKQLFEMAQWLRTLPDSELIRLRETWDYIIDDKRLDAQTLEDLRTRFEAGERVGIRVPVPVTKAGESGPQSSFFDLCLVRDDSISEGQDYFVRHMLAIPDMDFVRSKPVRGFLVVEDPPLHALLRDSEDPSHSKWRPNAQRVRDRYAHGRTAVSFVNRAMMNLVSLFSRPVEHVDRDALIDTFFTEIEELADGDGGQGDEDEGATIEGPGGAASRQRRFAVEELESGFRIRSVSNATPPDEITVDVAYTIRRGNPLKNYSPLDFQLDAAPIRFNVSGAKVLSASANQITISPTESSYRLEVSGFDAQRDLYVRAREASAT